MTTFYFTVLMKISLNIPAMHVGNTGEVIEVQDPLSYNYACYIKINLIYELDTNFGKGYISGHCVVIKFIFHMVSDMI